MKWIQTLLDFFRLPEDNNDEINSEDSISNSIIRIDDMYQFEDIPFEWHWVMELKHTRNTYWFILNMNNQYIALKYIDYLNKMIIESRSYIEGINGLEMCTEEIDFSYPTQMMLDSFTNTYVECTPYTKTGRISKYPVILHFSSSETICLDNGYEYQNRPYMGIVKIMQDGNIGIANITFSKDYTRFSFGLYGINLIIKRVDSINGNIYNYKDSIDKNEKIIYSFPTSRLVK